MTGRTYAQRFYRAASVYVQPPVQYVRPPVVVYGDGWNRGPGMGFGHGPGNGYGHGNGRHRGWH